MIHHDWSEICKPVDVWKLFQVTKCHDSNEEFQKSFANASEQRSVGWFDIDKTVYLGKNKLKKKPKQCWIQNLQLQLGRSKGRW